MSLQRTPLDLVPSAINAPGFSEIAGVHETNLPRNAALRVRPIGNGSLYVVAQGEALAETSEVLEAELPDKPLERFARIQECRAVWKDALTRLREDRPSALGGTETRYPFMSSVDLSSYGTKIEEIGASLAVAGKKLFYAMFYEPRLADLDAIGSRVEHAARERELTMTVTSSEFFVPWNLLYTHPDGATPLALDGSNFEWSGFWGYKHIVEHNPQVVRLDAELRTDPQGRVSTSFNYDENLDRTLGVACIAPQLAYLKGEPRLDVVYRKTNLELSAALAKAPFEERILYFCCHGHGSGDAGSASSADARIELTDAKPFSASDLSFVLDRRDLESSPFVFINACEGGQMTTMFYSTLAAELLRRKAVGLIGPQVDVPAIFAAQYAERFFRLLLDGRARRVGEIVRLLAREFVDVDSNPLGLIYSLYRGLDSHIF